jgi:hypothetical protein
MAFDFEALVGHLNIVGGRSISAAPPGMLVEVAPRKAARGRELDTFFVLVTPNGENTAPPKFYEQMAQHAAERYFQASGSVTAALRAIYTSLNNDLHEHNAEGKRTYEASMVCAVLRENELFLARAGSSVALYRHEGQFIPFPTEFNNEDQLFGPPLGVQPVIDVKMNKYPVSGGSRLLLADEHLTDLTSDKLQAALAGADISAMIGSVKELLPTQLNVLAAEFVPPDAPSPVPVKEAHSTAKAAKPIEKPTEAAAPAEPEPETEGAILNLPNRPPRRNLLKEGAERAAGTVAGGGAKAVDGTRFALDKLFPTPAEGAKPWISTSTLTVIALALPAVVVMLVLVMGVGGTGRSEFDLCVESAVQAGSVARSIPNNDVGGTISAWNAVLEVTRRCNELDPQHTDPLLPALSREGQAVIDALSQITRRDAYPLVSFQDAVLSQVVLQGLNLYVFDSQNQLVYRVDLAERDDGRMEVVANSEQLIATMRLNASVDGSRVDRLIDIAWAADTTQLIALDRSGLLVRCLPNFLSSCDSQRLLASERWQNPLQVTIWNNRLYILDPAANQIYRYDNTGGTFGSAPVEYFTGQNRPDIRNAVDFAIDEGGRIFILTADGGITRWVSGTQTEFIYASFPAGQQIISADAMFLDSSPIGQSLYIVSRTAGTIYETSLAGSFFNAFRVFDEGDFAGLRNVVVDPNLQNVYALSGNTVFVFNKAAAPAP